MSPRGEITDSSERLLERMTWVEFKQAADAGLPVIVPVGSMEQHGPHLPLATDALIACALASKIADEADCVVAPPVLYGAHSHPRSGGGDRTFPGSMGLRGRVIEAIVNELVSDLVSNGFSKVVVLNGHFENTPFLFEVLDEVFGGQVDGDRRGLLINYWDEIHESDLPTLFPDGFPGWEAEHAGVVETSIMEALHPHLVLPERKDRGGAARTIRYDVFPTPPDVVPPSGIGWDARGASPDIGRYLVDVLVHRIAEILRREGFAPRSE